MSFDIQIISLEILLYKDSQQLFHIKHFNQYKNIDIHLYAKHFIYTLFNSGII